MNLFDLATYTEPVEPVRTSFRDRTAAYFKCRPNEWIPAIDFESVGGRQAWRTRIAECRTQLGMAIENRCRTITRPDGTTYVLSEYRYVEGL